MLISANDLKNVANKILPAVDTSEVSTLTETLELKVVDQYLYINVTNKEYYISVRLRLGYNEQFHATVNANLFLKLIAQITSEDINLEVKDQYLLCDGNGSYKLPLIFEGKNLLELPKIEISNPTYEMDIDSEILKSILKYNSRELTKGWISRPVQKFYYVDEFGAITFTTGACVNSFNLDKPVKMLLSNKVVKLFKLFSEGPVKFTIGYDALSDEIIQTKVRFEAADIVLSAILPGDASMLNSVPVKAIRSRADDIYPHSITVSRNALLQALNRLLLFDSANPHSLSDAAKFEFNADSVTIYDVSKSNFETLPYTNSCSTLTSPYRCGIDIEDLKATIESCNDQYLTFNFGNSAAFVMVRPNIKVVIPEIN